MEYEVFSPENLVTLIQLSKQIILRTLKDHCTKGQGEKCVHLEVRYIRRADCGVYV